MNIYNRNYKKVLPLYQWKNGFYTGALEIMRNTIKETFRLNSINEDIDRLCEIPYFDFVDQINTHLISLFNRKVIYRSGNRKYSSDNEKTEAVDRIFSDTDVYYCMRHSKRFAFDLKDISVFDAHKGYEDVSGLTLEDFNSCCDAVIDLMYNGEFLNIGLKIIKTNYSFIMGSDREYEAISVSMLYNDGKSVGNLLDFYIIPELYPRLYINTARFNTRRCGHCKQRQYLVDDSIKLGRGEQDTVSICRLNRRKMDGCECNNLIIPYFETELKGDISLSMGTFANLVCHIVNVYVHRNSVVRSNGKHRELQKKASLSVPRNINGTEHVITLREYVTAERREKREWQGGHHSSPVEHERRPHLRHYYNEDGTVRKVVEVRGSMVNQGKSEKSVYKVGTQHSNMRQ